MDIRKQVDLCSSRGRWKNDERDERDGSEAAGSSSPAPAFALARAARLGSAVDHQLQLEPMTPGMLDSFFLYVADLLSTPPDHIKVRFCPSSRHSGVGGVTRSDA